MAISAGKAAELLKQWNSLHGRTTKGYGQALTTGKGEDQGEWDDEDGEWEYEDEEEEGYVEDQVVEDPGQPIIRPKMGGRNRMHNVGLHTIEIYYPQFFFKQIEMEEFDARPDRYGPSVIGKYTKGIGQIEARFPTDDEDPVSFAMTVTHRLISRMDREGFNETYKYSYDGSQLASWNSIGRLDIGSESLIDRSKSMKAYVMDLFERYGGGEGNIEGVDMYNACYGGQAAGLCAQNWVESDRWDGRYALAIATDISDAPYVALFTVGAACTGALYYPDAPLPHHSHRASCILHRFDFFKPVGWYHMGPVVDGKYSIDAYMNCVDTCYKTLRAKMGDRPLLGITDYNVFHTGGGYHVVKKAFERCIRSENPKTPQEQRELYVQTKLLPSVNLLKIIGPCHTVSSFLNISSVVMQEWDKALGKVLLVFTYGSGCASSMYQLRFDDIMWMEPLAQWKVNTFYRNAINCKPDSTLHQVYIDTWMKFDYRPYGRRAHGYGYETYELDAYYLMEIDAWGRRFYHRGGMRAGPLKPRDQCEQAVHYDRVEGRGTRERYGDLPDGDYHEKLEDHKAEGKAKSLEDKWRQLELDLQFEAEVSETSQLEVVEEKLSKYNQGQKVVVKQVKKEEGVEHTYHIVGTWSGMRAVEPMTEAKDGSFTYEVTVGVNGWEQFFLVRDNDETQVIHPVFERSYKDMPCLGPRSSPNDTKCWLISSRPADNLPDDDAGEPGSRYLVSFRIEKVKRLTWKKLATPAPTPVDTARYFLSGNWNRFGFLEMEEDPSQPGRHFAVARREEEEPLQFQIVRDRDWMQRIFPDVDDGCGDLYSRVAGIGEMGKGKYWEIDSDPGEDVRIIFIRDTSDPSEMAVYWERGLK